MLIENVVADAFDTKCYILARGPGSDCIIVDPGFGVAARLRDVVDAHGLRPSAVLLTHGHLDHTCSVASVCAEYRIPVYLHPDDHWMLSDPFAGLGAEFSAQFEEILPPRWAWHEPHDVRSLRGGEAMDVAALDLGVEHTPGHTPGSVMFQLPGDRCAPGYCLVGDVLYAGSIGRTDMPGGSRGQTLRSLKSMLAKPDETVLLTGHGEDSTLGQERTANPFVRQAGRWNGTEPAPGTKEALQAR